MSSLFSTARRASSSIVRVRKYAAISSRASASVSGATAAGCDLARPRRPTAALPLRRKPTLGFDQVYEVAERPRAQAPQRDRRLHPAVLARPDVRIRHSRRDLEWRRGALLARVRRIAARVRRIARRVHQRPHHRRLHGHVEVLASPRPCALVQCDRDVGRCLSSAVERGLRVSHRHRRAIAVALEPEQPSRRLDGHLRGGPERGRAALTVRRHRDVDQTPGSAPTGPHTQAPGRPSHPGRTTR